ncbi:hypothetical protein CASFOL_019840 [Castilleja foliolosa]|uniref:WAT1-related protein n=1 Tax=Castilleja foliolosa TaxID=1961234 RepID=A0ABD3CZ47_9LAMI
MMMVTAQIALAGVNILYKLAANNGMSLRVLIAYRFLFAAATVVPLALIFENTSTSNIEMEQTEHEHQHQSSPE